MENEGLDIRRITTEKEFENNFIAAMVKEGWWPGLRDAQFFLTCDPSGPFVGELNGKPVGFVSLTRYGDCFGVVGNFLVSEEHRGKGYGRKIFDYALSSVEASRNLVLLSVPNMVSMYEKRGFQGYFKVIGFTIHLPTALNGFSEVLEKLDVIISSVDQVDEKALLAYDSNVFGFHRHAFLRKWLSSAGSHAFVAIGKGGSVMGYVAARATFSEEQGYIIGPLFADSAVVAEKLLHSIFKELAQQDYRPPVVHLGILPQNGLEFGEKLQGKIIYDLTYMSTKGLPNACFDKWFAVTELGLA